MRCLRVRVSLMNTDNTFNTLIASSFTMINDQVFCNLVDVGIDPGNAYQLAFIDVPLGNFDGLSPIEINLSEDFDDAILVDL